MYWLMFKHAGVEYTVSQAPRGLPLTGVALLLPGEKHSIAVRCENRDSQVTELHRAILLVPEKLP